MFPIADPLAASDTVAAKAVQGFSVDASGIDGIVVDPSDPAAVRLPMPVRWLYLSGGGLAAGAGSSLTNVTVPTSGSDIIGRIAFWTDDDTSKVNVNTAAGDRWANYEDDDLRPGGLGFGSFWDIPIGYSEQEGALAKFQPWNREFQRYPGHPASVFLSAVFPDFTAEQLANISPRVAYGGVAGSDASGSKSGTVETPESAFSLKPIQLDKDRLYASTDELVFDQRRDEQQIGLLSAERLNRVRFFTTARSSAPEITLFGTPRIAVWPIHDDDDDNHRTVFDRLIAFCSTIPNNPPAAIREFYFQRADADSPTSDYANIARNVELYDYLRRLTSNAVPGFGSSFTPGSFTATERDQVLTGIFDYIRTINLWDPVLVLGGGSGGSPLDNKGAFTDGYNRDPTGNIDDPDGALNPTYRNPGLGQVTPITIPDQAGGNTQGFGRFPTLSEAGFIFIANAESPLKADGGDASGDGEKKREGYRKFSSGRQFVVDLLGRKLRGHNATKDANYDNEDAERIIQASFLLEFNIPMAGYTLANPDFTVRVELDSVTVTPAIGSPATLWPGGATATFHIASNWLSTRGGPIAPVIWLQGAADTMGPDFVGEISELVSAPFLVGFDATEDVTTMELDADGQSATVSIFAGNSTDPSQLVQQIRLNLGELSGTIPQPYLPVSFRSDGEIKNHEEYYGPEYGGFLPDRQNLLEGEWWHFINGSKGRYGINHLHSQRQENAALVRGSLEGVIFADTQKQASVSGSDVVRSVQVRHGDIRVVAANRNIDDTAFPQQSACSKRRPLSIQVNKKAVKVAAVPTTSDMGSIPAPVRIGKIHLLEAVT